MNTRQKILPHPSHEDDEFIEPCFLDRSDWIKSPPFFCTQKISEYLTHLVSRSPLDLTSHTQRIRLYRDLGDAEGIYGALLDLFIALGDKGLQLRKRLLQQTIFSLHPEHYEALSHALENRLTDSRLLPSSPYAVLSGAAGGEAQLVRQIQDSDNIHQEAPLEIAGDLLNSGLIQQAQSVLEEALLATPQHEKISLELLQIYRYTNNRNDCITMFNRLEEAPLAAHEQWAELILTLDQDIDEECTRG